MRQRDIARKYLTELTGSILIYIAILFAAVKYGNGATSEPWHTAIAVSPMIGFGLMILVVARQFNRVDEYQRKLLLETFAIAAAVTAGWTFSYGFLEGAGYPKLSMFTVWPVMGATWLVVCLYRKYFLGPCSDE